jgi:hypothetical protein
LEDVPRPILVNQLIVVCALIMATGLAAIPTLAQLL